MSVYTANTSLIVHPPSSISSDTRSVSPAPAPANAGQPPAPSDNTVRHMQPGPTPVARGDPNADFNSLIRDNPSRGTIRPPVQMPDMSAFNKS